MALSAPPARRTALLLAAGTALLPLQIWPPMPLTGMQLSDLLFALAFLHHVALARALPPLGVALPCAAFAGGAAASALAGGSPVKLLGHLMLAALAWMAAGAAPESARLIRRALVGAVALAALAATATVGAFYAGLIGYDAAGRPDSPLLYIHGALVTDDYPRPRGTMVTGALMTSLVATGLCLLWFERGLVRPDWLRGLILALAAVTLFFAFSRTIATVAIVLICAELWRRQTPRWARGAGLAAALVYAGALWVTLRYQVVLNPTEPWAAEVLAVDGDRFARWRIAAATLMENPVLGLGPGLHVADGWSAHNTWLNLWAGIGVVPLAAFAFLMLAALRRVIAARHAGLACALIVALIESLYIDIEDLRHVWLLLGLALVTPWPGYPQGEAPSSQSA